MIGVFDSGSGGLTVLESVSAALPEQDFLYFGDHDRAPYGSRSAADVYDFSKQAVDFLLSRGCRLILIACNTAAAVALRRMQQTWLPQRAPWARVLGVHVPLVEAITGTLWSDGPQHGRRASARTVGVFATPRTVASGSFLTEITARAPEIAVLQQPCPGLADAIEAHADARELQALVDGFAGELLAQPGAGRLEATALACTHYPFVAPQFRHALPAAVEVMTQPALVAEALRDYLRRHPQFDRPGTGRIELLTSGDPARVNGIASLLPDRLRAFRKVAAAA